MENSNRDAVRLGGELLFGAPFHAAAISEKAAEGAWREGVDSWVWQ